MNLIDIQLVRALMRRFNFVAEKPSNFHPLQKHDSNPPKLSNFSSSWKFIANAQMKRKNEDKASNGSSKKRALSENEVQQSFRRGLFDDSVLSGYTKEYAHSQP
jgi:hypothetical protein